MKIAACPHPLRVENTLTEAVAKGELRLKKLLENWRQLSSTITTGNLEVKICQEGLHQVYPVSQHGGPHPNLFFYEPKTTGASCRATQEPKHSVFCTAEFWLQIFANSIHLSKHFPAF